MNVGDALSSLQSLLLKVVDVGLGRLRGYSVEQFLRKKPTHSGEIDWS